MFHHINRFVNQVKTHFGKAVSHVHKVHTALTPHIKTAGDIINKASDLYNQYSAFIPTKIGGQGPKGNESRDINIKGNIEKGLNFAKGAHGAISGLHKQVGANLAAH